MWPRAECRWRGLHQASIQVKTAVRSSDFPAAPGNRPAFQAAWKTGGGTLVLGHF